MMLLIGSKAGFCTAEVAEYHGPFVNFTPLYQWPKPVQQPHPPILVGGTGPTTIDRVLEFGDGWIPMAFDLAAMAAQIADLQKRAADAGRGHIPVTACAVVVASVARRWSRCRAS